MIKFKKLRVLLVQNEMTQLDLVAATGIRQPTISAICNGKAKHLPISVIDRICETLNCQPGDFMEYVKSGE